MWTKVSLKEAKMRATPKTSPMESASEKRVQTNIFLVKFFVPFGPGEFPIILPFGAFLEVVIFLVGILNTGQYQMAFPYWEVREKVPFSWSFSVERPRCIISA